APPPAVDEVVAVEPDIATATARPAGYAPTSAADYGHNLAGVAATGESRVLATLPEGAAIHAGFWRRCAAYTMDYAITLVLSYVVGLVGGFALAAGQGATGVMLAPTIGG